jgi:hypothetical protein
MMTSGGTARQSFWTNGKIVPGYQSSLYSLVDIRPLEARTPKVSDLFDSN